MMYGDISKLAATPVIQIGEPGRLDSWKEIAGFFRREVRTVQLWEQHEHLPVHRHQHRKVGTVHAYKTELGEWWRQRCAGSASQRITEPVAKSLQASPVNVTRITLSLLPFEFPARLTGSDFVKRLKERVSASLDGLLPARIRVACSLTAAQRHALGSALQESDEVPNADYLIQGKIEDLTSGLRVDLRLISGKDGSAIWSHTFDFDNEDWTTIYVQLADSISRALSNFVLITPRLLKHNDALPAARYAYLRGRYFWSQRSSSASILQALQQFQLATEADPNHAAAYSGMADCYAVLGWLGAIPRETSVQGARNAAIKALALDPSLAECHVSMGCVLCDFDWDWEGAEREMLHGIYLNPVYAQAYCWYGQLLISQGRCEEAIHATQIAQQLEPSSPIVALLLGSAFFHAQQCEPAIQQFQHVLHMQPDHIQAHCRLGLAYEQSGDLKSALTHLEFAAINSVNDASMQTILAYGYARAGNREQAQALLTRVQAGTSNPYLPVLDAAAAFAALGDYDAAFEYLYRGFDERSVRMTNLKSDPRLFTLHGDARFSSLARRMRLI